MDFPLGTLYCSESRGDFERVQSGGRGMEDPSKQSQQLTLGNRFTTLQD